MTTARQWTEEESPQEHSPHHAVLAPSPSWIEQTRQHLCDCGRRWRCRGVAVGWRQRKPPPDPRSRPDSLLPDTLQIWWTQCNLTIKKWAAVTAERYIVESTNKAEPIRPEEQSKKADSCREDLLEMQYSWKGHKDRQRHKNRINRSGQAWMDYVKDINYNIPTTWRRAHGDSARRNIKGGSKWHTWHRFSQLLVSVCCSEDSDWPKLLALWAEGVSNLHMLIG